MALAKYFGQALGKQSLGDALRGGGGWKVLLDGNLAETLVAHGPGAALVGTDAAGNRYFEKADAQAGRHRWVVYAGASHYRGQDPSAVPPEWHAWLHHISDAHPGNSAVAPPAYAAAAGPHPSGTPAAHAPKGAWGTPHRRNWRKYEPWWAQQGKRP